MTDHAALGHCNKRNRELSGFAQRTHNELFVVPGMRRIQKCGNRHGLYRRRIGGGLVSDLDVYRMRRDQSSIKKLRSCSLRLG